MSGLTTRLLYGIHSVTPYNTADGTYYGMLRVLKGSELALKGSITELRGGSNRYPWDNEDGAISADLNLDCMEYPDFLFQLFLGKTPSTVNAEASGNVSALTAKLGSSVIASTGFLSSIGNTTPADFKFGTYVLKVTGATAVKIYWSSNIDALRGTAAGDYTDDTLLIQTISPVTTSLSTVITGHGITLVSGGGTIGMTVGDTATFSVRPVSTGSNITATFGGLSDIFPEFGALLYSQKRANNEMFEIDVFRAKAVGVMLGAKEKAFSGWQVNAKCAYDQTRLGVFSIRHIRP